jgi:hypothetical protein
LAFGILKDGKVKAKNQRAGCFAKSGSNQSKKDAFIAHIIATNIPDHHPKRQEQPKYKKPKKAKQR